MRYKPYPPRYSDSRELDRVRRKADPIERYRAADELQRHYSDLRIEAGHIRSMAIVDLHLAGLTDTEIAERLNLPAISVGEIVQINIDLAAEAGRTLPR